LDNKRWDCADYGIRKGPDALHAINIAGRKYRW